MSLVPTSPRPYVTLVPTSPGPCATLTQVTAAHESRRVAAEGAKREAELEERLSALSRRVEAQGIEMTRQSEG